MERVISGNEAAAYGAEFGAGWAAVPGALAWLEEEEKALIARKKADRGPEKPQPPPARRE